MELPLEANGQISIFNAETKNMEILTAHICHIFAKPRIVLTSQSRTSSFLILKPRSLSSRERSRGDSERTYRYIFFKWNQCWDNSFLFIFAKYTNRSQQSTDGRFHITAVGTHSKEKKNA